MSSLSSPRFPWNPSAYLWHLANPWTGRYPFKNPLYVRVGTISGIDNTLVQVTFEDGSVSGWIPFDETGRTFVVGRLIQVLYKDAATTIPNPFYVSGACGAYEVDQPHFPT